MTDVNAPKPYEVSITVPATRDEVWESVTQPPMLRQWFGWDYDGLDAEIQQIFVDAVVFLGAYRMGWADGSFLEVKEGGEGTLVRAGRGKPPAFDPQRYDAIEEGWRAFLTQLRHFLVEQPKGKRRTLYLTGESTGRQAMSLVTGVWQEVGTRVAWTVDGDGHLVVVSTRQPLTHREAGRVEIIVSTYGADDLIFQSCRTAWAERWAPLAREAAVTVYADA